MVASEKSQNIAKGLVMILVVLILGASLYLIIKKNLIDGNGLNGDSPGAHQRQDEITRGGLKERCEEFGGNWLEDYSECVGIEAEQCEELEGSYDDCASSCRHNSDSEMCIQVCVKVCKVSK